MGQGLVSHSPATDTDQGPLLRFVQDNKTWLAGIPAAFVSVGMTAALKDDRSRDEPREPRHVEFRNVLPKTPIGKVLRRDLRDAPKE